MSNSKFVYPLLLDITVQFHNVTIQRNPTSYTENTVSSFCIVSATDNNNHPSRQNTTPIDRRARNTTLCQMLTEMKSD